MDQLVVSHDQAKLDGCRIRKRKCDRLKPHCGYCVKIHRNQGIPVVCTYPTVFTRKLSANPYKKPKLDSGIGMGNTPPGSFPYSAPSSGNTLASRRPPLLYNPASPEQAI
jgi:hypothetical protein